MPLELWLAFVAASAVVLLIPGPTVLLVVSYALGQGRRSALATVAGVTLGDLTAVTLAMLGLGALLATSAELFTALRWVGAAYLIYLGIKLWRAPVTPADMQADSETRPLCMFGHAYLVTALNPKATIFFVAFLPQFLDPAAPAIGQMAILGATFVTMAAINALGFALLASAARGAIRSTGVQRAVNRVGGSLLIGSGLLAVGWKRAAA
jgi:threonine/homoserine/homoserine lactone efflux protein